MSGFVGVYSLDGQPVSKECISRMSAAIAHRGRDADGVWVEGAVGFSHRSLWAVEEAVGITEPIVDESQGYAIVADVRLDNRQDLLRNLRLTQQLSHDVSDTELLLAAYIHWGDACVEHLLGAFAFVIWDAKRQQLYCARDHFGVKPFYYAATPGRKFVFGSEIKALLVDDEVGRDVNEERVADYLLNVFYDKTYTFYADIKRLPPGHFARVTSAGVDLRTYYTLDEVSVATPDLTEKEWIYRFRELFLDAVQCRLRSRGPVGAMLSGGLDSASIVSAAQMLRRGQEGPPLLSFSYVYPSRPACDESAYIDQVLAMGNVRGIKMDGVEEVEHSFEELLSIQAEPYYGPNASLAIYGRANAEGCRVLLNGHGGDEVVSHGYTRLRELAIRGGWLPLAREVSLGSDSLREALSHYLAYLRYAAEYHVRNQATLNRIRRLFSHLMYLLRQRQGRASRDGRDPADVISESFNQRIGARERAEVYRQTWGKQGATAAEAHYRTLADPLQVYALEVLDRWNAAYAIEPRYPMWDKRLVEFCLKVPSSLKRREGFGRYIMREAMQGLLPEEIRWRRDKTDFTGHLRWKMQQMTKGKSYPQRISSYVRPDVRELLLSLHHGAEDLSGPQLFALQKALLVSQWIRS